MSFSTFLIIAFLGILLVRQELVSRQIATLNLQMQAALKHLDVEVPKTLAELLHQYGLPNTIAKNATKHLENNDEESARKLLKEDSSLSDAEIENLIQMTKALTSKPSYFQ